MVKNIAFTICAKNYIGLSLILKESYLAHNPDDKFLIIVADEVEESIKLPEDTYLAKKILNYPEDKWLSMAFKYNLTEFCTSIKPDCFKWVFEYFIEVDKVCYLDPDIHVFNSFETIWGLLDSYKVVVTPHLCTLEAVYSGDKPEDELLFAGQFNLGFIAVRKSSTVTLMMSWWANRLIDFCYGDRSTNLCYDQKWIDFLIAYMDKSDLFVLRELGYNLAPWNFYERECIKHENTYCVRNRINGGKENKLIFVHYSGYNYKALMEHQVRQGNIAKMKSYADIIDLLYFYGDILKQKESLINQYIDKRYTYGFYDNGMPIDSLHRQLYRGLGIDQLQYGNPFSCKAGFYRSLKKRKLIVKSVGIDVEKIGKKDINPSIQKKLGLINSLSVMLLKILGVQKYKMLLRFLKYYGQPKYHIHLISKEYKYTNIKM